MQKPLRHIFLLLLVLLLTGCNPGEGLGALQIFVTATPEGSFFWEVTEESDQPRVGAFSVPIPTEEATEPPLNLEDIQIIPTSQPTGESSFEPIETVVVPTPIPAPTLEMLLPESEAADEIFFSQRLGINFINSVQHPADPERFAAAIETGSGWNRFPMYWNDVEREQGEYFWEYYDDVVIGDVQNGFHSNVILIGTSEYYRGDNSVPKTIYEPIFNDGTDEPGLGKLINPANGWARYVYVAVQRYKPGGDLARVQGWAPGLGITEWEIWNEPDFSMFWDGSVEDYARLLEVANTAIHYSDPDARVIIGGLVIWEKPGWIVNLLDHYKEAGSYPFDVVAIHSYSHPANVMELLQKTESLLAIYDLRHIPVWVNESGVPVWDDYPGPSWATRLDQITWRATQDEQAAFIIQNAAYAFLNEVEVLFHFQLYDDCGNQPRGTTFAPHDGSYCLENSNCWGDALGLMRNTADNACFNQHPEAGTARPSYDAWKVVANVFGGARVVPLGAYREGAGSGQIVMMFARPNSREIIRVMWNESGEYAQLNIPAYGDEGILIQMDGSESEITPSIEGTYSIGLNPASNKNHQAVDAEFMIGGAPVILIESSDRSIVSISPMIDDSRQAVLVKWRTNDPRIELFEIYYKDENSGGGWFKWFETDAPGETLFIGGPGITYSFFARGLLSDGTWTELEPVPQARTTLAE